MELVLIAVNGFIIFGPITIASIAMGQVSRLRRRVEDLERVSARREFQRPVPVPRPEPRPGVEPPKPPAPEPAPRPVILQPDLVSAPFPPPPPRVLRSPEPGPAPAPKEEVPLENLIGERVLPRLGVIAIVLGLGLLIWYSYRHLGPEGKLALTAVTGVGMVVSGVLLRRHPYTQLLGGCLIGGGWSVLYLTAYAAHFVEASRITTNPLVGFILLLAVSQAALIHALRYRNETIAGLAFLLTIGALFLAPRPGPACWLGMGLAAATLVALALKERWIRLCAVGAALVYGAEIFWLQRTPPADILPALGVLAGLWAMWILTDYLLRPTTDWEKRIHGLLVAINFGGLLAAAALVHQWFHLLYMGWVWMSLGALYALHAIAGRKLAWRPAHLAALGFAAVLVAIGTHVELAGLGPVFAWMGLSVALFLWGLWRKDEIPRLMGIAGLGVTLFRFWIADHRLPTAYAAALAVGGLLYAVSMLILWRSRAGRSGAVETSLAAVLSHAGAVAFGLATWKYAPDHSAGAIFAAGGLVLALLAPRVGARWLTAEGVIFLVVAAIFMGGDTLDAHGRFLGMSLRVASTVPILFAWLGARLALPTEEPDSEKVRGVFSVLLLGGLLALLRCELGADASPAAWAVTCGAWFLWSRRSGSDFEFALGALGAVATVMAYSTVRTITVPGLEWTGPVPTGAILIAILAATHLTSRREVPLGAHSVARDAVAAAMALTGFILLDREMAGTMLTGSWAVLGLLLAGYGFLVRDRISRWSSLLLLGWCAGKVVIIDLARYDMPVKIATLITLGSIMVALSFVYARHHRRIVKYLVGGMEDARRRGPAGRPGAA